MRQRDGDTCHPHPANRPVLRRQLPHPNPLRQRPPALRRPSDGGPPELKDKWMKTLERCCEKLARNQIYNARIYAVVAYYAEIIHRPVKFKDAKLKHLFSYDYTLVPFRWTNTDAWFKLSAWWGSDEFKRLSAMKRNARLSVPDAQNHGGLRSTARTQQCLVTMK